MYINKETNASYNLVAPGIEKHAGKEVKVFFPTAELVNPAISDNEADVKVECGTTIIDLGTISADTTLNLTQGNDLNIGARAVVKATNGEDEDGEDPATFNIEVSSGDNVAEIEIEPGKTVAKEFVWTGTAWIAIC